jgi:hypothetical protein
MRRTTPHPYKRDNSSKSLSTEETATAVAAAVTAVDVEYGGQNII